MPALCCLLGEDMESLPLEPDPPLFTVDMAQAEEDNAATDQMPVNVTTINASANPSGEHEVLCLMAIHRRLCHDCLTMV